MTDKPTYEELEHTNFHTKSMVDERVISDRKYADKWVEKLATGLIVTILLTVLGAILALVVR